MGKTVLLIRNVAPENYGGGESYQLELAKQLKQNDFVPIIATSSTELIRKAKKNKISVISLPYNRWQNWSGLKNLLFPVYYIWQLRLYLIYKKLFQKYKPDVANIQSRDDWIAGTKAAKKCGIRVLWTDHADFRSWVLLNVDVKYKNFIGKWILRCARGVDKIIMISDFERKWFDRAVAPRKFRNIVTIRNGVKDEYVNYERTAERENAFCYVGRLVDDKGVNELIMAFEQVHNEFMDARLDIYGSGDDVEKYKCEVGDNVVFHGFTNEPLRAIAESKIFVLPSYCEGLSISLIQAAMLRKMIIATNVDGNPEVVINKETGLLVPAKNVKALTEAMKYVLKNGEETCRMAEGARRRYKKDFDFEKIFKEKMLPLYYNDGKEI